MVSGYQDRYIARKKCKQNLLFPSNTLVHSFHVLYFCDLFSFHTTNSGSLGSTVREKTNNLGSD